MPPATAAAAAAGHRCRSPLPAAAGRYGATGIECCPRRRNIDAPHARRTVCDARATLIYLGRNLTLFFTVHPLHIAGVRNAYAGHAGGATAGVDAVITLQYMLTLCS
jgi:hypothetical protein